MKVAWHEVPGASAKPARSVGNGMIRFVPPNEGAGIGKITHGTSDPIPSSIALCIQVGSVQSAS
jgi:hypothetical protein